MEIAEENIPSPAKEFLAAVRGALGRDRVELKGYDFSRVGVSPFFGLYPKGSINPLLTVSVDDVEHRVRLTPSHALTPQERSVAQKYAEEFWQQEYKII